MNGVPWPIYGALLFFLGCILLLRLHSERQSRQHALPGRTDYLVLHSMTEPACYHCGGIMLGELGLRSERDSERLMRCLHCGTTLYRFQRSDIPSEDANWVPLRR